MSSERSRRSFFVDLLSGAAGGWVALTGLLGAASSLGGCGDDSAKPTPDTQPVVKYGGVPDGGQKDSPVPTPKYGGDFGPVVKYGGPPDGGQKEMGPTPKYGGPSDGGMMKEGMATKYGGMMKG
jgi:hypothetical protein